VKEMGSFKMEEQALTLPVTGMSCVNCAANIHKTLDGLDGITKVNVNFAAEQAMVTFDPDVIGLDKILEKIVDLGFKVVLAEREMPVTGMSCANCAANIEKTLKKDVSGVINASVNFASERLFCLLSAL
jgi:Cu+-exporting ATPase